MSMKARLRKLEGNGGGLRAVNVFAERGEAADAALARTLRELGINESQVGHATLWPHADDTGQIRTLIDRCGGDPSGLVGWKSHEEWLEELD